MSWFLFDPSNTWAYICISTNWFSLLVIRNYSRDWRNIDTEKIHRLMLFTSNVILCKLLLLLLSLLLLFGTTSTSYGSSQVRGWNGTTASGIHHSHNTAGIWTSSMKYTTAHDKSRYMMHWARLGIKPTSSWILVALIFSAPQNGTPLSKF